MPNKSFIEMREIESFRKDEKTYKSRTYYKKYVVVFTYNLFLDEFAIVICNDNAMSKSHIHIKITVISKCPHIEVVYHKKQIKNLIDDELLSSFKIFMNRVYLCIGI